MSSREGWPLSRSDSLLLSSRGRDLSRGRVGFNPVVLALFRTIVLIAKSKEISKAYLQTRGFRGRHCPYYVPVDALLHDCPHLGGC